MGFADDMKNTYNNLRSMKTSKQSNYFKVKSKYETHYKKLIINLNKKNLSKKEQLIINEKIRRKIINQRIRVNVFTLVATISLVLIVFIIIKYLY